MQGIHTQIHPFPNGRVGALVWPREHGAWGMLLVPLVTGAWAGLRSGHGLFPVMLFSVTVLALFCLRTPVEALLQTSPIRPRTSAERQIVLNFISIYAGLAALAAGLLIFRERAYGLIPLGVIAMVLFLAQALLRKLGRETRIAAQLVGALGLTSTALGAYYAATGRIDHLGVVLWAANGLLAANQIHFVQVRIHSSRAASFSEKLQHGRGFLIAQAVTIVLLAVAWRSGILAWPVLLAFTPVLARGFLWFFQRSAPLNVHRLGFSELAHALGFGVLLILSLHLHP
ncbi:MAG TPA: YwiC-like family protein [Terriglobia bacterium]|jgi:hypothetical protein|nr:YwiC-like family protein [Terriglobia bacterium]